MNDTLWEQFCMTLMLLAPVGIFFGAIYAVLKVVSG